MALNFEEALQSGASAPPREPLYARNGIAASAHPFVSHAALEILRAGGTAVDAAIAAAAVLMCVEPRNGHLGGDAFMLVNQPSDGRVIAFNGSGAAPAAATLQRYRELGSIPTEGLLASTVPGVVDLWFTAHDRYGRLPFTQLLAPAIAYARAGIPMTPRLHRLLTADAPVYAKYPAAARVFLPGGCVPAVGSLFAQPQLAVSLERIASGGCDAFYRGAITEEMVAFSQANGGLFSLADFDEHHSEVAQPLMGDYRGFTIYEQPPVSQGIIVLIALGILRHFDLRAIGLGSTERYHLLIEALKLAFDERMRTLGDPRFVEIPITELLSERRAVELAATIDPDRARAQTAVPPAVAVDTTYAAFGDGDGMMVSYIHSLFAGSGVVLGETGVLMNNRLAGFTLDAASPNVLAPRKRPVHTLNSYIVHKDGAAVLAGGTPGAHWQVQTNVQILTNVLDFGLDPAAAIAVPRFTFGEQLQRQDNLVRIESRVDATVIDGLRLRGHDVEVIGPWDAGSAVQLVARDRTGGMYRGATEVRRSECTVAGY